MKKKRKIATIRTKFDLLQTWKSNYPKFLEKNKDKWEEVLIGATENEINGVLEGMDYYSGIEIKIQVSRKGCWEIEAAILCCVLNDDWLFNAYIVKTVCELESELKDNFSMKLNEKGRELLDCDIDPEEDVIKVQYFSIVTFEEGV
jgi:hypothetical protein